MSEFTRFSAPKSVRPMPDFPGFYQVTKAFTYEAFNKGSGLRVEIPEGFVTDLASVPFGLRWLLPPDGDHGQAAIVHDQLCRRPYLVNQSGQKIAISRRLGDELFLEAMQVLKVRPWRQNLMYCGVRAYGHLTFGADYYAPHYSQ